MEWFAKGNAAFKRKDFAEAEQSFTKALETAQDNATVWSNRSAARARLGRYEEAISDARESIRLEPGWAKGYFRLAIALYELGLKEKCYRAICFAFALEPKTQLYRDMKESVRSELLEILGSETKLHEIEKGIVELLPKETKALGGIGIAYEGQGRGVVQLEASSKQIPVTVLSGFLGSGKTTLMSHLLANEEGMRIALIVNDMSEVNIDAVLIESNAISVSKRTEELVELSNGCICCTLRDDLLNEILRLAGDQSNNNNKVDYILIESTGISEPIPVAQTFLFEDIAGRSLARVARLDTMVTVVDASSFMENLGTKEDLVARNWQAAEGDERTISQLLVDQVEFSNVIVLNKCDLVSPDVVESTRAMIQSLNPSAEIISTSFSKVDPRKILNTHVFDMQKAAQSPGWLAELRGQHIPETEEYGIRSFSFQTHAAMDLNKIFELSQDTSFLMDECHVIRSKGFCWIAQDPRFVVEWASAGRQLSVAGRGFWESSLYSATEQSCETQTCGHDHQPTRQPGKLDRERHTQLIFIGVNLDVEKLRARLEACVSVEQPAEDGAVDLALLWGEHADAQLQLRGAKVLGVVVQLLAEKDLLLSEKLARSTASKFVLDIQMQKAKGSPPDQAVIVKQQKEKEEGASSSTRTRSTSETNSAHAPDEERLDTVRNMLIELHEKEKLEKEDLRRLAELSEEYARLMKSLGLVDEEDAKELDQNAEQVRREVAALAD